MSEKEREELLDRREFTVQTALALLAGVTITVSGCGDDDDNGSPTSPTVQTDISANVGTNHGHRATISAAQLTAGNAIALDIRGDATHPHTVELTSDEVRRIAQRQQVSKSSTTDNGHNHTVTFN